MRPFFRIILTSTPALLLLAATESAAQAPTCQDCAEIENAALMLHTMCITQQLSYDDLECRYYTRCIDTTAVLSATNQAILQDCIVRGYSVVPAPPAAGGITDFPQQFLCDVDAQALAQLGANLNAIRDEIRDLWLLYFPACDANAFDINGVNIYDPCFLNSPPLGPLVCADLPPAPPPPVQAPPPPMTPAPVPPPPIPMPPP